MRMPKILTAVLLLAATSIALAAEPPRVRLETNLGTIEVELDPEKAPISTENFLGYVRDGFYDGLIFHRVIRTFMIQGGGFDADMQKRETKEPIKNEAANGLRNDRGTLAMARTNVVDSATAQFFINVVDNDFLNHRSPDPRGYGYAVFGKVVAGMDVVDRIREVPTGNLGPMRDVPREIVRIERAYVVGEEAKAEAAPAEEKPAEGKPAK